jgi:transposase
MRDLPHVWWALDRRDNLGGKERARMAYSKQFKEQAMRLVTERGMAPTTAARELGMPRNTLDQWLKRAGWRPPAKGPDDGRLPAGAPLPDDPAVLKVRLRQLEEENRRLRMEKDILKKATAFFASQNP